MNAQAQALSTLGMTGDEIESAQAVVEFYASDPSTVENLVADTALDLMTFNVNPDIKFWGRWLDSMMLEIVATIGFKSLGPCRNVCIAVVAMDGYVHPKAYAVYVD